MSRSVLELILKDKYPVLAKYELAQVVRKLHQIDNIKRNKDLISRADSIRRAGNESLHAEDNVKFIFNEMTALNVIRDLKKIIEFFYK